MPLDEAKEALIKRKKDEAALKERFKKQVDAEKKRLADRTKMEDFLKKSKLRKIQLEEEHKRVYGN